MRLVKEFKNGKQKHSTALHTRNNHPFSLGPRLYSLTLELNLLLYLSSLCRVGETTKPGYKTGKKRNEFKKNRLLFNVLKHLK